MMQTLFNPMKSKLIFLAILLFTQISCYSQAEAVRGVWLTNVDSDVLTSKEKLLMRLNF
jgi:uncharacterized lipoprotein YddW (UPF0748 family)